MNPTRSLLPLCLVAGGLFAGASLFAQGPLAPPGAPAPTMKTLDQLEPRTPISALPYTITNAGSYYLASNFVVAGGVAITISTDDVTLDLKGFTITTTNNPAGGFGIRLSGGRRNVDILNGNLQGGGTNNGGVFSGPGFLMGIDSTGANLNVRVSGVNVSGCQTRGINLGTGHSIVVAHCTVRTVGADGLFAGVVSDTVVEDCGGAGISARTASNCSGSGGSGTGLSADTARSCQGASRTGIGLNATSARNCSGSSSNNIGLNASVAQNCTGFSTNNTGLSAETARNCKGTSTSGTGLNTDVANNCVGVSASGNGLVCITANNSSGNSSTGSGFVCGGNATSCSGATADVARTGLDCTGTANACTGANSGGGTAIRAAIGIGCRKLSGNNNIAAPFLGTVSP